MGVCGGGGYGFKPPKQIIAKSTQYNTIQLAFRTHLNKNTDLLKRRITEQWIVIVLRKQIGLKFSFKSIYGGRSSDWLWHRLPTRWTSHLKPHVNLPSSLQRSVSTFEAERNPRLSNRLHTQWPCQMETPQMEPPSVLRHMVVSTSELWKGGHP